MKDIYTLLKRQGKLHGTITHARSLGRERQCRRALVFNDPAVRVLIPFGDVTKQSVINKSREMYPKKRRWESPAVTNSVLCRDVDITTVTRTRFTRRASRQTTEYRPQIRSFGVVTRRRLCWYVWSKHAIWLAKRGWHFGCSTSVPASGRMSRLYVCMDRYADRIEYHWYFSSDDLMAGEKQFWQWARQRVYRQQTFERARREDKRITNTVITVDVVVPHNGVRTRLRVSRKGPMSHTYAIRRE